MNLRYLLSQLSIQPKGYNVAPFQLNWAQDQYLDTVERQVSKNGRIRIIVLKARQIGISTVTEALLFTHAFVYPNYRGLVVAHEARASYNLFNMTKLYWNTYPFRQLYTPRYASKGHLEWIETNSNIQVSTAGNSEAGRSATIHFLHASEYAFWPDPRTTMLALRQTIPSIPGSAIIIESTANGVGNAFHDEWLAAKQGDSEYVPLFFPWYKHPEYLASHLGLPYHDLGKLDADERALVSMGLSADRLAWRRWAIKNLAENDLKKFHQEYPTTDEEAFLSTGTNVFPLDALRDCYHPEPGIRGFLRRDGGRVSFVPSDTGPLTIYRRPSRNPHHGQYYVAGDPTRTTRGDFGCAQVLNRRTLEQVAVWRGRIDPATFAEQLYNLALYYNTAHVSIEKEGPGELAIGKLLGMNYPRLYINEKIDRTPGKTTGKTYGWSTTAQTKHTAIGWLLKVIVDRSITIHHDITFNEMRNYVTLENGTYGPATDEGFDDTVMAAAIGVTCNFIDTPPTPDDDYVLNPLDHSTPKDRLQLLNNAVEAIERGDSAGTDLFGGDDVPWYQRTWEAEGV